MTKQRLKILSKYEINELYNIPHFNSNEKEKYFSLDKKEYEAMSKCGSLASKLHFTLQLGYFKAASQFFNCAFDTVTKDVDFVLKKYFENAKLHVNTISKQTRHTNQASIAKILNYQTDKSIIQENAIAFLKNYFSLPDNNRKILLKMHPLIAYPVI